ncbi:MAG: alpha/beta hydrolase [Steroidobacteraceae bacterium]|nr:alpha/beta hydrolase [Steroidobacteraceae bacterium]
MAERPAPARCWLALVALCTLAAGCAGTAPPAAPAATYRGAPAAALDRSRTTVFSDAELRKWYAQGTSRFVTVDGVAFHLRDEGRGPPLLLINGHLGSLHMWEPWMPALQREFRVIRIDYAPYGLSGPDPSGRYDTQRSVALVLKLADQLGLGRFHVGGTSNGALVALFLAIEHPERVDRVVVSTLPASRPPPRRPSPEMLAAVTAQKPLAPFQSREFFVAFLRDVCANDAVIDDALVDRYWALNNRAGAKAAVDAYIQTQYAMWDTLDVPRYYARLTRPMLIQWGADGVVLPRWVGDQVAALFAGRPVTLVQYPGAGHLPMIEQPEATVRDAIAFLQGR